MPRKPKKKKIKVLSDQELIELISGRLLRYIAALKWISRIHAERMKGRKEN